jgi:hypothetical protein
VIMQPVSPRLPHSIAGIDPVKWYDILQHANGGVAAGNAQQWGRRRRGSAGPVRADLNRLIFFSRKRVG